MKIIVNKFFYILFIILSCLVAITCINNLQDSYESLRVIALIQFILFIIWFLSLSILGGKLLSLYSIFLISFYVFQNGQILLYGLGLKYDFFYVKSYNVSIVIQSVIFSTMCLASAFAAGIFSLKSKKSSLFYRKINSLDPRDVFKVAKLGFLITSLIAVPLVIIKFIFVTTGGYFSVIKMEESIPAIIKLIESFYVPFGIMLLVYNQKNKFWKNAATISIIIWSLCTALTGDRSVGIAGILIIAILFLNDIDKRNNSIKTIKSLLNNIKKYFLFFIVCIMLAFLIPFAFNFRMQTENAFFSIKDIFIETIGSLGFSFFPLVLIMNVCNKYESFLYGKSLLGGLIGGLIPQSIDLLGISSVFMKWSAEPSLWIEEYYNYTFGIDFSLNAECFSNFGWNGFLVMLLLCSVISRFLKEPNFRTTNNLFNQYSTVCLLFSWFTLPRRKSYYIYNYIFYYVLIIGILLLLTCRKKKN